MEFDNAFEVPLPPEQAWPVLMNIQGIAPCMPGAQLTEVVDDKTYKGNIGVRLGPVALTFAGTVVFEEIDNAGHSARVRAQGNDLGVSLIGNGLGNILIGGAGIDTVFYDADDIFDEIRALMRRARANAENALRLARVRQQRRQYSSASRLWSCCCWCGLVMMIHLILVMVLRH
mgnify:CR=1 FL=1